MFGGGDEKFSTIRFVKWGYIKTFKHPEASQGVHRPYVPQQAPPLGACTILGMAPSAGL